MGKIEKLCVYISVKKDLIQYYIRFMGIWVAIRKLGCYLFDGGAVFTGLCTLSCGHGYA